MFKLFGVSNRQLNLFMLATQFSKRSAEKINNCEVLIMKMEGEKRLDYDGIEEQRNLKGIELDKLEKYNEVINNFDNKYFN